MIKFAQIYCICGVSKSEFNIPHSWKFGCFLTDKGRLFQVNSTSLFGDFLTEKELRTKLNQYYRKEKLNNISNLGY